MIGRAALGYPWVFSEAKQYLLTGIPPAPVPASERWALMLRHTRMAIDSGRYGDEPHTMRHMRGRLMAYAAGFPGARSLRARLSSVSSLSELEDIARGSIDAEITPSLEDETAKTPA
jgi:tRNA-dihydrouridine synthase B